jgi:hypothetical protein
MLPLVTGNLAGSVPSHGHNYNSLSEMVALAEASATGAATLSSSSGGGGIARVNSSSPLPPSVMNLHSRRSFIYNSDSPSPTSGSPSLERCLAEEGADAAVAAATAPATFATAIEAGTSAIAAGADPFFESAVAAPNSILFDSNTMFAKVEVNPLQQVADTMAAAAVSAGVHGRTSIGTGAVSALSAAFAAVASDGAGALSNEPHSAFKPLAEGSPPPTPGSVNSRGTTPRPPVRSLSAVFGVIDDGADPLVDSFKSTPTPAPAVSADLTPTRAATSAVEGNDLDTGADDTDVALTEGPLSPLSAVVAASQKAATPETTGVNASTTTPGFMPAPDFDLFVRSRQSTLSSLNDGTFDPFQEEPVPISVKVDANAIAGPGTPVQSVRLTNTVAAVANSAAAELLRSPDTPPQPSEIEGAAVSFHSELATAIAAAAQSPVLAAPATQQSSGGYSNTTDNAHSTESSGRTDSTSGGTNESASTGAEGPFSPASPFAGMRESNSEGRQHPHFFGNVTLPAAPPATPSTSVDPDWLTPMPPQRANPHTARPSYLPAVGSLSSLASAGGAASSPPEADLLSSVPTTSTAPEKIVVNALQAASGRNGSLNLFDAATPHIRNAFMPDSPDSHHHVGILGDDTGESGMNTSFYPTLPSDVPSPQVSPLPPQKSTSVQSDAFDTSAVLTPQPTTHSVPTQTPVPSLGQEQTPIPQGSTTDTPVPMQRGATVTAFDLFEDFPTSPLADFDDAHFQRRSSVDSTSLDSLPPLPPNANRGSPRREGASNLSATLSEEAVQLSAQPRRVHLPHAAVATNKACRVSISGTSPPVHTISGFKFNLDYNGDDDDMGLGDADSDTSTEIEVAPAYPDDIDLTQRREEYVRLFMRADVVYSSPLTRAVQTALAAMCGHSSLTKTKLTLYR